MVNCVKVIDHKDLIGNRKLQLKFCKIAVIFRSNSADIELQSADSAVYRRRRNVESWEYIILTKMRTVHRGIVNEMRPTRWNRSKYTAFRSVDVPNTPIQ